MSLILDALRKSEAERRRGQAPSLYAATPVPGTRARPEWLRLLPFVAGAVLLLVALVAWFGKDEEPATKAELQEEATAPSLQPPTPAQLAAKTAGSGPAEITPPAAPPPPPAATSRTAAPTPTVEALVKAPVAPPKSPARAPTPVIEAAPTLAATPESASAPAAAEATEEALPPIAALDAGTRGALPAMRMSMHVYNDDASRRFATIDGQRVVEGSRVGSATVVEIRRDGVVLDVGGQRVLLPKP
jgi:general secretion pathway protein B